MNFKADSETRIVYFVSNFKETRNFYENILDLDIFREWDHGGDNGKGIIYKIGSALLEFLESAETSTTRNTYIYIEVKDVEDLWKSLSAKLKSTKIIEPIAKQEWGHTNFSIEDINGFQLKFFSYT